jgi:hypothetical protein
MTTEELVVHAEWQIWHQDTFDRACPRRVEASGRGLAAGLEELWARHLLEAIDEQGKPGFARFNLWWNQAGKSVEIVGEGAGLARLRQWVWGGRREHKHGRKTADKSLLRRIATAHGRLVLAGQTSEPIVAEAANCADEAAFWGWLKC